MNGPGPDAPAEGTVEKPRRREARRQVMPAGFLKKSAVMEAQLKKAQAKVRRTELELARFQMARRDLPLRFPEVDASMSCQPALVFPGFRRETNPAVVGAVRAALSLGLYSAAFNGVAEVLGCDRMGLLLVETFRAQRDGVKCGVLRLRFEYNPEVSAAVYASGRARYLKGCARAWEIVKSEAAVKALLDCLPAYFAAVVDLDALAVSINLSEPPLQARSEAMFELFLQPLDVETSAIMEGLRAERPQDVIAREKTYIHAGTGIGFVPLPAAATLRTVYPWLLLRYSVASGKPRYVTYFALTQQVEAVTFGTAAPGSQRSIAHYADTCRVHGLPTFTVVQPA